MTGLKIIAILILFLGVLPYALWHAFGRFGEFIHRRHHPDDAMIYDKAMAAVRDAPSRFPVKSTYELVATDGLYKLNGSGNLQVGTENVITCMRQRSKISRTVSRLWDEQGRSDPRKREVLRKLPR